MKSAIFTVLCLVLIASASQAAPNIGSEDQSLEVSAYDSS